MSENVRSEPQLTSKQETFINALLTLPTITAASKAAGVTDKTARLWMKQEHVQAAYRAARKEAFDEALAVLMTGTTTALHVLLSSMKDMTVPANVRVNAARIWLEQAINVHKLSDLEQQVKALQDIIESRQV